MTRPLDSSLLDPTAGARRLLELAARIDGDPEPLAVAMATRLVFRAGHILGLAALAPARDHYSVALQALMHAPEPAGDPGRDPFLDPHDFLGWLDLLDLISEPALGCVARRLHRGWQDRTQSCRQARKVSERTLGFSVSEPERGALLAAWGTCQRLLVIPPPARFHPAALRSDRRPLLELIARLAPRPLEADEAIASLRGERED